MAANNNVIRVVPDIVPGSGWVRVETKNVLPLNREEAVRDVLKMELSDKRYYKVIPRKDCAIFVQF